MDNKAKMKNVISPRLKLFNLGIKRHVFLLSSKSDWKFCSLFKKIILSKIIVFYMNAAFWCNVLLFVNERHIL